MAAKKGKKRGHKGRRAGASAARGPAARKPRETPAAATPRRSSARDPQRDAKPALGAGLDLPGLRELWPHMLGPALAVCALYVASMPRTVCLEDDGLFIMSAHVAGVNHPPGYPLFSILGWLFTRIPVGSPAFRVHLVSAVFGALTCAVIAWLGRALGGTRFCGWAAALAYGVSRELWAQSIIAEVYTINTFLFFTALALWLAYRVRPEKRTLAAASLVTGLGLAHHWPLFVLSGPAFVPLVWPRRRELVRSLPRALAWFGAGLLPYAFVVIRSLTDPSISFYGPIRSLDDFFYFVSRKGYSSVDRTVTAGVGDQLQFLGYFGGRLLLQLTAAGAALAAVGAAIGWRRWPRQVSLALALAFLGSSVGLIALLHRDFGYLEAAVFEVYPLIPYGVFALLTGVALSGLAELGAARIGRGGHLVGWGALAALLAAALVTNAGENWRRDYTWAEQYGEAVLDLLEPDAVLFTYGDSDTGPIGYLHRVEGLRPDVTLYNAQGLVFSNRLFPARSSKSVRREAVERFLASTDRPVYQTGDLDRGHGTIDHALVREVDRDAREGQKKILLGPKVFDFTERILNETDLTDTWTLDHRNRLLATLGERLGPIVYLGANQDRDKLARPRRLVERLQKSFFGKLGLIDGLTQRGDPDMLLRWASEAEARIDETVPKKPRARLYFLEGFLHGRKNEIDAAIAAFERSVELEPDPKNTSVIDLLKLYAATGKRDRYWSVRRRIFAGRRAPKSIRALDDKMR